MFWTPPGCWIFCCFSPIDKNQEVKKTKQTNNKTPTYKVKLKKKRGGEKVCVFEDLDDLESIKILL